MIQLRGLLRSYRSLKKNIKLFKAYKEALENIVKTLLYYYEYKRDHPQHKKRGIICEELPKHLQLSQVKKEPILPDWPSIYGTLLAGIKALFINLNDFKQLTVKQFTESADSINAISGKF